MKNAAVISIDYTKGKNKIHIVCGCPFCGETSLYVWDTYEPMANKEKIEKGVLFTEIKKTLDDETCNECDMQFLVTI